MPRRYLDFDVLIEATGGHYRAKILESPAGQAVREFELPFSQLELENLVLRVTRTVGELRRDIRRLETPERQLVQAFGGRLFDAVFGGTIQGALQSSLNEAYRREAGLRIRLRLSDAPELADLPWEYLYSPSTNQFLSLSPDTPVVRYLDLPTAVRPLAVSPPLRVLVMISSPTDYPQLSVSEEWSRLNDALRDLVDRGLVTLTKLDRATLAALQRPLRRGEYHIFHFIGHGGFDEQANDGALLLEDESGRGRLVSGQDLGVMLTGHRSLRLVILNACEGARSSPSDPFAGAAQSLLQQGIPAAIAMQFEISDKAAITFAHEFYGAVADGYPIDAALAESRRAIFAHGNEVEWATPVLYMRSPDGRVFRMRLPSAEAAEREAKEAAEREAAELVAKEAAEREAEEREAKEAAEREAREAAQREAKEAAERNAAEREAKEAEREAKEPAQREAAVGEGQGLPLSRAAQLLPAAAVLFGSLLLLVGSLRVDTNHLEVVHSLAQKPLLFMDNLTAFVVAPVLGLLLLLRRASRSLRIGGLLAGVGLEQIGTQLGIFLTMTDHQGGDPNFGWGSFTALIGAVMLLLTSIALFYRLRRVESSHTSPVFTRGSRTLAVLAGAVFVAAWFIQDDVSSNVPLVFTIPLAVGTLVAAASTLSPNRSQATRLFLGSAVLAFGGLVALGYLFSFLSLDYYFGDISETSLGIRAVSGLLLIGAAVIADRAGRREPVQEVRTV